jgi:hypothetical protein
LFVDALFRHTRRPWQLIVVDNGSTDGTVEFLAGIPVAGRETVPVSVTLIRNEQNRGFPAAVNQRLRAARGDVLVLLNNKTRRPLGDILRLEISATDGRISVPGFNAGRNPSGLSRFPACAGGVEPPGSPGARAECAGWLLRPTLPPAAMSGRLSRLRRL